MLLEKWVTNLEGWRSGFKQQRTYVRAIALAVSMLCALGRRTPSQAIRFQGRDDRDWSAFYNFFSRAKWMVNTLFEFNAAYCLKRFCLKIITVSYDQVDLRKTGVKSKLVGTYRDPTGPKHRVNLQHAQRFLHAALSLPLYSFDPETPRAARSIPIRFKAVPKLSKRKPKPPAKVLKQPTQETVELSEKEKAALAEQEMKERENYERAKKEYIEAYEKEKHDRVLTWVFVALCHDVRKMFDHLGYAYLTLVSVADGSFCNKTVWGAFEDSLRHVLLVRLQKNAQLCFRYLGEKKNKIYGDLKFTPEQIRKDCDAYPYQKGRIFHGGAFREIRFKVLHDILWQKGSGRKLLTLIVIAPTPYRLTKTGKVYYRQPAYLLCSKTDLPILTLIQCYFDRWQIEVAHREMKTDCGIGQAEVRNDLSVERVPAFMAAAYGALCIAVVELFNGGRPQEVFGPTSKWYTPGKRVSCNAMLILLREEIRLNPQVLAPFDMEVTAGTIMKTAMG